ncbi:hypothetical protein Sjap_003285 [Stephania japonica]|uniref:Uncharacterized protein n=1 Tax=Stephania japonica TaxID=461633 RepID=A0AAP0KR38_9MAGN
MYLYDEEWTRRFFSSLPALKRLVLESCTFYNHQKLTILVSSINHLRIAYPVFLPFKEYCREIEINAPNLDYLYRWTNRIPKAYILFDMPVLEEALIDVALYENPLLMDDVKVCHNACNLLAHIANVKKLSITADLLVVMTTC